MYAPAPGGSRCRRRTLAEDVVPEQSPRACLREGVFQAVQGAWVLAAQVQVSLVRAGGVRGDRHGLDQRVRVALHQHAVLEGARFGFVRVADDVVGMVGLRRRGLPFAAGGEGGAATPDQAGVGDLADDSGGAQLEGPAQGGVATVGAVVVQRRGVHDSDAAQQDQLLAARLGNRQRRRRLLGCRVRSARREDRVVHGRRRRDRRTHRVPGLDRERRRSPFAQAQTRAALHAHPAAEAETRLDPGAQLARPGGRAREVRADVEHGGGARLDREHGVEGGDAVRLRRRNGQPSAQVVEGAVADPADPVVDGVQPRQQQVAAVPGLAAALGPPQVRVGAVGALQEDSGGPSRASTAARSSSVGLLSPKCRSTYVTSRWSRRGASRSGSPTP